MKICETDFAPQQFVEQWEIHEKPTASMFTSSFACSTNVGVYFVVGNPHVVRKKCFNKKILTV